MAILKEVCVENYDGALSAFLNGATSVELCDNLSVGGTTPSYGVLSACVKYMTIPVIVLIRPRGGNFVYTDAEVEVASEDIMICKKLGIKSVRIGAVTSDGKLNESQMTLWKRVAGDMNVSCHMAFDETKSYTESLDMLIRLGFDAVLTKGGQVGPALKNRDELKKLIDYADGRINIIPGSGVTHENVSELADYTKAKMLHGTQILAIK